MMSGGFSIRGDLVTLSDIDCPVLAVIGEVDDIGQPASVRGIKRAAPQADVYEFLIRTGHFGLVVGSKAATQTWPTVAAVGQVARRRRRIARPGHADGATTRRTHRERCVADLAGGARRDRRHRDGVRPRPFGGRRRGRRQQVGAHAGGRDRTHPAPSGPARPDQRPHPDLARPHHVRAGPRRAQRRVPAVRRSRPHLRGSRPPYQQRRARPDRRSASARAPTSAC